MYATQLNQVTDLARLLTQVHAQWGPSLNAYI